MHAELARKAGEAVRKGAEIAGHRAESRLVNGPPVLSLMLELRDKEATLCVVGTHGHSRLSEIAIGGVAGELLHSAPCAVYVARPPAATALFPRAVVAGVDGSSESEAAIAVARYLVERFACPLSLVSALGGKGVNRERVAALGATAVDGHPVAALTAASKDADILVVGSRGLHGPQVARVGIRTGGAPGQLLGHRRSRELLKSHAAPCPRSGGLHAASAAMPPTEPVPFRMSAAVRPASKLTWSSHFASSAYHTGHIRDERAAGNPGGSARGFEPLGETARRRLNALFDELLIGLTARDLGPIVAYGEQVAAERFSSGYDLSEVQEPIQRA